MARTPAQQKHPLLNGATTALTIGGIALLLKGFDTITTVSSSPNANPVNVFLDTSDGVGGVDMGRLVPLWGTLLIPIGLVLLAIYFVVRSRTTQTVGGQQPQQWQQQPSQQQPAQPWQQQPGQQQPWQQAPGQQPTQPEQPQP